MKHRRAREARRGSAAQRGYDTKWTQAARGFLAHHPACADCGAPASVVDHDPPHGGDMVAFWDKSRWRPLCASCHSSKTVRQDGGFGRPKMGVGPRPFACPVTLVCGPPGSGKTAYVREHARHGDLVVDVDALYQALSNDLPIYEKPLVLLPFVTEARDAVINRLHRESSVAQAWVITSGPKRSDREPFIAAGARVVVLDVSPTECLRRISQDPRRADKWQLWEPLVARWWEQFERDRVPA